ncbi:MAG: hypothetical protein Q8L64_04155 [bacterium]|nr:hypothetical protein [bacterium]
MSKNQMIGAIEREIKALNWRIDLKIVQGLSYAAESRRHKRLVSQLRMLAPRRFGIFSRMTQAMAMFTL